MTQRLKSYFSFYSESFKIAAFCIPCAVLGVYLGYLARFGQF